MLPTCPRQLLLALTLHPCRFGINVAMYSIPAVITTVVIACHPLTGPASSGAAGAWGRAWRRCVRRRQARWRWPPDPAICAACSGFSTEPRNFAPQHSFASRWLCATAEKEKMRSSHHDAGTVAVEEISAASMECVSKFSVHTTRIVSERSGDVSVPAV